MTDDRQLHGIPGEPSDSADFAASTGSAVAVADTQRAERNALLRASPPSVYAEFVARSEAVPLELRVVLQARNAPIEYVHFIRTAIASTVIELKDGQQVEVITTGREGLVPHDVALGGGRSMMETFVRGGGVARRMAIADFATFAERGSALENIVHRYARATLRANLAGGGLQPAALDRAAVRPLAALHP